MRHTKDVGPARLRLSWIVSTCSTAPRRPDHTSRGSREGCLFWIKEGRTGSEERFAFMTRSAATN